MLSQFQASLIGEKNDAQQIEIRPRSHHFAGFTQQLHFARRIRDRAVFFVSRGRRGETMSACCAVSVKNISCTIINESFPRPVSDFPKCLKGLAPTTYSAFNLPDCAASTICGAVNPTLGRNLCAPCAL